MSDLHKLVISAPDGFGYKADVTLDGQPLAGVKSVTLRVTAEEMVSAVIEFHAVEVEVAGLADVVAKLTQAEGEVSP